MKSRWYSPNSQLSSIKCVQIAWIANVLTTCPKKIADVLDKEGSEYLSCLLFLTRLQYTSTGFRTSVLTARCLQSGGKKHLRHSVFRLARTRQRPQIFNLLRFLRRLRGNRRDEARGPHAEVQRVLESIKKQTPCCSIMAMMMSLCLRRTPTAMMVLVMMAFPHRIRRVRVRVKLRASPRQQLDPTSPQWGSHR